MALANEVQVGRYKAVLERLLGMKGEIAVQQLGPELLPVLNLGNDRPEWSALAGERLGLGSYSQAAVAGEVSAVVLWNNASTSVIATVDAIYAHASTAGYIYIGHLDVVAGGGYTQGASGLRDSRFPRSAAASALQVYGYHAVGSPITAVLFRGWLQNNVQQSWPISFVLTPLSGVAISHTVVNTTLTVSFVWKERPAQPSELRLG